MTLFDNTVALEEGWAIVAVFDCDEPWRLINMGPFDDDETAWEYVATRALAGGLYHLKAMKFLEEHSWLEFEHIETHVAYLGLANNLSHLFKVLP